MLSNRSTRAGALALAGAFLAAVAPSPAAAQGSLSGQGFGYPVGGLSARAQGSGGAQGEFDPLSPLNPAALGSWGRAALYFQVEPEFRRIQTGDVEQRTTTSRFPLVAAAVRIRDRYTVGLAASTFLDRSWTTTFQSTQDVGGQPIVSDVRFESRGSVADVRLAAAALVTPALRVGLGAHVLTGQNRLFVGESFADTLRFGTLSDSSVIDYSGTAASAGVDWRPLRQLGVAASYRVGGTLRTRRGDSTLTSGTVPGRLGVAVRFDGITGASLAASYTRTAWGDIGDLGSSRLQVDEGPEYAVGADVAGPRVADRTLTLRAGARRRTLPFGIGGFAVRETTLAGGLGALLAADRAAIDFTVQRASRTSDFRTSAGAEPSETAWLISLGLTVRP